MTIQKLGIFGGTFNPPHVGHLILAETAADALDLDRVFFVPAGMPPHKLDHPLAPAEHRLAMVKLAAADNPKLVVSRVDMERPGPHYATDMMQIFQGYYPQADIFFLMGSDSLRDLLSWHEPQRLIEMASLVVMQRPSIYPDLAALSRELPGLLEHLYILDAPEIEISSSEIVKMLAAQQSVRYRVPDPVLAYLLEHRLYGNHSS
ncbi:MAG: nicotinate (nicotinamide) nucleotide adenylyltransferase [Chloroflexi bacterium]|nr:nicotinate (nicotinamide) nucleotide adenylyltransferase [Chloroflexota bacterium]